MCVDVTSLLASDSEVVFESEGIHVKIIKGECEYRIEECSGITFDLEDDGVWERNDVMSMIEWDIIVALVAIRCLFIQIL